MTFTILCIWTLALVTLSAQAEPTKNKADKSAATPTKAATTSDSKTKSATQEQGVLTGSYIKRTYHRSGKITDGPNQVVVLDRNSIEQSGAVDLNQLLIRRGIRR
ncbi:MAG: hypothetical protein EPO07_12500 [Verrucomicrobia bacterium]|nr:MAG: hypothetical protein EPO07_12500 [Verrucomicrobiota bacterium]